MRIARKHDLSAIGKDKEPAKIGVRRREMFAKQVRLFAQVGIKQIEALRNKGAKIVLYRIGRFGIENHT